MTNVAFVVVQLSRLSPHPQHRIFTVRLQESEVAMCREAKNMSPGKKERRVPKKYCCASIFQLAVGSIFQLAWAVFFNWLWEGRKVDFYYTTSWPKPTIFHV